MVRYGEDGKTVKVDKYVSYDVTTTRMIDGELTNEVVNVRYIIDRVLVGEDVLLAYQDQVEHAILGVPFVTAKTDEGPN